MTHMAARRRRRTLRNILRRAVLWAENLRYGLEHTLVHGFDSIGDGFEDVGLFLGDLNEGLWGFLLSTSVGIAFLIAVAIFDVVTIAIVLTGSTHGG